MGVSFFVGKKYFFVVLEKKYYFCGVKSVVGILGFSGGKWLEMRIFDGLRGWDRLGGQTVDCYGYGLDSCVYLCVDCKCGDSAVRNRSTKPYDNERQDTREAVRARFNFKTFRKRAEVKQ